MTKIKLFEDFDQKPFQIFQDMDGCLTDFEGSFKAIKINKKKLSPEEYDRAHGKHSFWKVIETEGLPWWEDMPWMPDGRELWEFVSQYDPIILSAPSRQKESAIGKIKWCNRELGFDQDYATRSPKNGKWPEDSKIILNSQKYLFNKRYPNSILIDDTKKKIEDWRRNGGIGIHHRSASKTIDELKKIIEKLNEA